MTTLAAPLAPAPRRARPHRSLGVAWARLVHRVVAREQHDPTLRAGAERPPAPMLMSISLGGVAHLR